MFTRLITACAVSVTLAFSSAAFAASTSFIDNGSYTTDTISGLDWRDVTASLNRSYNDVSGQFGVGGNFEGYRYATGAEFIQLINNTIGTSTASTDFDYKRSYNRPYFSKLRVLNNLLGVTHVAAPNWTHTFGFLGDIRDGKVWQAYFSVAGHPSAQWTTVNSDPHSSLHGLTTTIANSGSFLVRDTLTTVPIPAAAFMFAPALLGFLGLRRKAKNLAA